MTLERPAGVRPAAAVHAYKLFAPPEYRGVIPRRELLDRIFAEASLRVVLFQGPAGHGKSTLMQQAQAICAAGQRLCGWLSFDDADNDMRRFTVHFQALLREIDPTSSDLGEVNAEGPAVRRRMSDAVIDRLSAIDRPVALFLDEFQTLGNKLILGFFREVLERLPPHATVFIGSRTVPEIGLSRLVVNRHALVLRTDDLRFSASEVGQFFAQSGDLEMRPEEVDTIHRQTEGWPAALQLFRLSLASPSVRGSLSDLSSYRPRELADYLADNVLGLQTPRVQLFMRHTSLLTRLSAPLCDAVLDWQDSQSMLLFIERSGLFLRSLDHELRWFRYHTLFSGFLEEQLRETSPDVIRDVHQRAARWYHAHGLHEEAMHHAVEAGEYSFAADVLNLWAARLVADGHLATVERWYDRLPLDEVEKREDLMIKIAYALSFLRRHHKLRPLLEPLGLLTSAGSADTRRRSDVVHSMIAIVLDDVPGTFDIVKRVDVSPAQAEGFHAFELSAANNVLGYRALAAADYEAARDHLMRSRAYSDAASADFSGGYSVAVAGGSLIVQGQIQEAVACLRSGLAEQRAGLDKSVASASLVCCYVQALYESNDLRTAESLFTQYHDVIGEGVLLDFLAVAYQSISRIEDIAGRPAKAAQWLDEAENIGHSSGWPRLVRLVNWERVRRYLLMGDTERARVIASRIPRRADHTLPPGMLLLAHDGDGDTIGQIRLDIHSGRHDQAQTAIAEQLAQAQQQHRVRRQVRLLLLETLSQQRRGATKPAQRVLRQALQLAESRALVRCFLDEGPEIAALLHDLLPLLAEPGENSGTRNFVLQLLDASGTAAQGDPAPATFQPLDPLTDREKEILIYLAKGVSNKEMARRMFVSENTVKFHLKNIYSKLAVASRLQAINAAREMRLL